MSTTWAFIAGLACTLAVVAIAALIIVVARMRQKERERAAIQPVDPFADHDSNMLRGDPRALKAGDIFDTHGETLTVRGSLRLKEGGYFWSEHLIDTGTGVKRWLSVEEDPDLELFLWTALDGDLPAPGPRHIDYDGKRFTSKESGRAQYSSQATTGLASSGYVTYHDYRAADGTRLSFEDFDETGRSEVALGLEIQRHELTIYPRTT